MNTAILAIGSLIVAMTIWMVLANKYQKKYNVSKSDMFLFNFTMMYFTALIWFLLMLGIGGLITWIWGINFRLN